MRPDRSGISRFRIAGLVTLLLTLSTSTASAASLTLGQRGSGLLGVLLMLGLVGFGVVTFAHSSLTIVSDTVSHSLGRSFAVGLLAEIMVLPTFAVIIAGMALTVVGILLIPFVVAVGLLLVLAALGLGLVAVAHAMGETWSRRRMALGILISPNSYRYLGLGLLGPGAAWVLWALFGGIPVAGMLVLAGATVVTWLLVTLGLGATILSRAGIRGEFAGHLIPPEALTDEYLWATPQLGVPAVKRPTKK
jgi:hypothetical protein